uniref:Uncharacterized protein n=1 Tax=Arundo donax TaxID=35708 RepID=A0A0A9CDW8_ARUDO
MHLICLSWHDNYLWIQPDLR